MIKAVLFDLDGTLVDSLDDIADTGNRILREYGYPPREANEYKYLVGNGFNILMERLFPKDFISKEKLIAMREIWRSHYGAHCLDKTRAYAGMPETLEALFESGIRLGVITNKPDEQAQKIIGALFKNGLFDCVSGIAEGVPVKPDPYLCFKAFDIIGVKNFECLFVGDTSVDIKTAINSGCVPVGALWGFRTEDELINAGASHLIKKPSDLLALCG